MAHHYPKSRLLEICVGDLCVVLINNNKCKLMNEIRDFDIFWNLL